MMSLFSLLSAVVTGWETENKYRIHNTLGQQVYFAAESKSMHTGYTLHQDRIRMCRVCNSMKFETGWNLPPVIKY